MAKIKEHFNFISRDSMLLIGLGLAITYWILESLINIFVISDASFIRQLIGTDTYNIYTRVIILCLFVMFGSHVQYTINKRKAAENALKESEEKYRNILESIEEGYYEVDTKGNFTFFNDSICNIFGYSKTELMGMNNREYMDEENVRKIRATFDKVSITGQPDKAFDCEYIIKDGSKRIIETSISLITDANNDTLGFRGVARDVTEKKNMERELLESYKYLQAARAATILGLAKLAEYRDQNTGAHLERIREYCKIVAREIAQIPKYKKYITDEYIEDIYHSSILHDIGKVGIPDAILLKPGRLTPDEFEVIKNHPSIGGDAIDTIESRTEGQSFLTIGKEIAYHHHEKWDGTGYPDNLKGENIPLSARIVTLADVYDALRSKRSYKEAYTHQDSISIMSKDREILFDPDVFDAFLAREKEFEDISLVFKGD